MPRLFYISLGAAAGVVAVRRAARLAAALTPESVAGSVIASVRDFTTDVRVGMAEREAELRGALGIIDSDETDGAAGTASGRPRYEGADDVTVNDLAASNGRRAS